MIFTPEFRKQKSSLYWNLIFYFKMMKLPTFFMAEKKIDDLFIQEKIYDLNRCLPTNAEK